MQIITRQATNKPSFEENGQVAIVCSCVWGVCGTTVPNFHQYK